MSKTWTFRSGDWNCICDVCSIKIKASKTKQRWDGLIVCPSCFEHRHPQDFIKVRQDKITVPFLRPRPTDVFVSTRPDGTDIVWIDTLTCTPLSRFAVAGIGVSGCATAGRRLAGDL